MGKKEHKSGVGKKEHKSGKELFFCHISCKKSGFFPSKRSILQVMNINPAKWIYFCKPVAKARSAEHSPPPQEGAKRRSEDLCDGKRIRNNTKGGSAVLEKGREAERERLVYLMVYIDKNLTKFW